MKLCGALCLQQRTVTVLAALVCSLVHAQTPATGVRARATPADYAVSQQSAGVTYAASLLPPDQVRHLFAVDISKTYLVFEIACYPSPAAPVPLNPGDFLVKSGPHPDFVRPADAPTVAAVMQDKNTPRHSSGRSTDVATQVGVGYESGTDPYTGRRVHGTYTEASVGVANGRDNYPPPPPRPGSSPQDRTMLENQLGDKSLAQGSFTAPVAGFLYFPAEALKKSKGAYDLQYVTADSAKLDLNVPDSRK